MTLIRIQTRNHLLSTLAEAAELEHNLMCLYLYAVFSLKELPDEGLSEPELRAVRRWRKNILGVCVQEMSHLALVNNLMSAVGGAAHFGRSDFPVQSGLFPAEFTIQLAPFSLETLDHFIFLERPDDAPIEDSAAFAPETPVQRESVAGRLMTSTGDYSTVGQLYQAVASGIERLCASLGERELFLGSTVAQLNAQDVKLEGLDAVRDKASALAAVHLIVEQGEGARNASGSHFETFTAMKAEYLELVEANPKFNPARPAARNPVMRLQSAGERRVYISERDAAECLDIGNAVYMLMLRFLTQIYAMESRPPAVRLALVGGAFSLMHAVGDCASLLSTLPANADEPGVNAGLTFSLDRYVGPVELSGEKKILAHRAREIARACAQLRRRSSGLARLQKVEEALDAVAQSLHPAASRDPLSAPTP